MPRSYPVLVGLLTGVGLAAAGCGGKNTPSVSTPTSTPTPPTTTTSSGAAALDGTVGPGFTIALTKGGAAVTTLTAGTYTLNVDDMAAIHNFHLTGPGVDVSTDVAGQGKKSFTITLTAGKYHYQCDPHSAQMNGDFTVS